MNRPAISMWPAVRYLKGFCQYSSLFILDGWTMQDLIYVWKDQEALKFADNISLPGGFKMGDTGQDYCDVKTATGCFI